MKLNVNGSVVHVATGGKEFDSSLPTVLFLHGSGCDSRFWALQTRWFAFNGYSVLAPDFPAHSLSKGEPLTSIEDSAQWLIDFLNEAKTDSVHIVGHSQGFLSGIELASLKPELVKSITGIGTAATIPVNPMLIETAQKDTAKAAGMMLQWGVGPLMQLGASPTPGMQPIAIGKKIMSLNPLAEDLQCCADYQGGVKALESIHAPSFMILAGKDKMTPLKSGKAAAEILKAQVKLLPEHGHMLPMEAPKEVLLALREFISTVE